MINRVHASALAVSAERAVALAEDLDPDDEPRSRSKHYVGTPT